MISQEVLIEHLLSATWEELGPVMQALADRVNNHRQENGGMTPRPVFKPCIELGTSYACLEFVLWIIDQEGEITGVALKKRDAGDQGWEGLKHVNGRALMPHDTWETLQERLLDEITRDEDLRDRLRLLPRGHCFIDINREDPDRRVNCLTPVFERHIKFQDVEKLEPGFVVVPLDEIAGNASIFDHHREVLLRLKKS